jgi:hypothetical protein
LSLSLKIKYYIKTKTIIEEQSGSDTNVLFNNFDSDSLLVEFGVGGVKSDLVDEV